MTTTGDEPTGRQPDVPAASGDSAPPAPPAPGDAAAGAAPEAGRRSATGGEDPDVGFTLTEPGTDVQDPAEQAGELLHRAARLLAGGAPENWRRLDAAFACASAVNTGTAIYTDEQQRLLARTTPSPEVLALVREHRLLSAGFGDGPWWRLLLTLTREGRIEADYDFGAEPFPDEHLFAPEVYRADLEVHPRETLPVWLAAHLGHGNRQLRPPEVAAERARADRADGARAVPADPGLPPFPVMAARWAVLSAAFVAAGSQWGPRLMPALRWFEGARRSGCSLYALPGGRAVLSGGVWNAPALDAAYNRGEPLPDLYRAAPDWVADPVLNRRAVNGLLTFCYWWDGARWYRGESPEPAEVAEALPGIWTSDSVARIVTDLLGDGVTERQHEAVATLVAAAEAGAVTREALGEVFGPQGSFDIDNAFYQLLMGGVTAPERLPEADAVARVAGLLTASGEDTAGYPVEKLRAERVRAGWMVYVPVEPGDLAIGRAIFYVADDGVLERSSSSVAPSQYLPDFERRFRQRNRAVV